MQNAKCFFERNGLDEVKREGTADDIYYIQSVEEDDQDQDGNAFEILTMTNVKIKCNHMKCNHIDSIH